MTRKERGESKGEWGRGREREGGEEGTQDDGRGRVVLFIDGLKRELRLCRWGVCVRRRAFYMYESLWAVITFMYVSL